MKRKDAPPRTAWDRIRHLLMAVFALLFVFGAWMTGTSLLEQQTADGMYRDLRERMEAMPLPAPVLPDGTAAPSAADGAEMPDREEDPVPEPTPRPLVTVDFAPLTDVNADAAAWISAEGTVIDYPVVQGEDNAFYLDHLFTGEKNKNGSLFIDFRNSSDFSDRNTVIYGHNMRSGAMFHVLNRYKKQDFYDAVPTMYLATPAGDYRVELICGTVEDGRNEFVEFSFESEADFAAYVESFRARSTFESPVVLEEGDRIVSLCTCTYEWNNARYMVMGRLVPLWAEEE